MPEVWGYDALTGLAHLAAQTTTIGLGTFVVQLGSRSPALLATSALSLQSLSGGRFRLGMGVSGPQVMEGWHGVRFARPVQATRETIEILRTVSRGEVLRHDGPVYPLPLPDSQGRALRPMLAPAQVPVYVAAMGPANLALTGEVADGWLGNLFIPEAAEVFLEPLRQGAAQAGRDLADLDLVAPVAVELTADDDGRDRGGPTPRPRLRLHHRGHGQRHRQLLQPGPGAHGLRPGGGRGGPAVARRPSATRPPRPSPPRSGPAPTWWARPRRWRRASSGTGRRASPP